MPPLALVVENDSGTRKLLEVLLERQRYEVDAIESGETALLLTRHIDYAVVVLDLFLASTRGTAILEAMTPEQQRRVIVLSSASEKQLSEVKAQFQAVTVIRKPFEITDLLDAVEARRAAERPRSFVETFCRASVRAGAKAGVLLHIADSRALHLVTSFGYAPGAAEAFCPISLEAPYPIAAASRNGVPVWLASLTLAAPDWPLLAPVWKENESNALAALPVRRGEAVIGAIGLSFREPQQFSDAQRAALSLIADIASEHLQVPSAGQSGARSTA